MRWRVGHFSDLARDLNDLLHALDWQSVFLTRHFETDQLTFIGDLGQALSARVIRDIPRPDRVTIHGPFYGAELTSNHFAGIQNHDHRFAVVGLDHAGHHVGMDGALDGTRGLDVVAVHGNHIGHTVHHEADRLTLIQHHHAGGVVVFDRIHTKDPAQLNN